MLSEPLAIALERIEHLDDFRGHVREILLSETEIKLSEAEIDRVLDLFFPGTQAAYQHNGKSHWAAVAHSGSKLQNTSVTIFMDFSAPEMPGYIFHVFFAVNLEFGVGHVHDFFYYPLENRSSSPCST